MERPYPGGNDTSRGQPVIWENCYILPNADLEHRETMSSKRSLMPAQDDRNEPQLQSSG